MPTITLPGPDGRLAPFTTSAPHGYPDVAQGPFNRIAFSAVHVVADPMSSVDPWVGCAVDWDATIAYRTRLWDLGLGVARSTRRARTRARACSPAAAPTTWCRTNARPSPT
jgi:hypothetical protein